MEGASGPIASASAPSRSSGRELVAHALPFTNPVRRMAARHLRAPSAAGFDADGAGSSPRRSRIHAAWRASTDTIVATAASDGLVRLSGLSVERGDAEILERRARSAANRSGVR